MGAQRFPRLLLHWPLNSSAVLLQVRRHLQNSGQLPELNRRCRRTDPSDRVVPGLGSPDLHLIGWHPHGPDLDQLDDRSAARVGFRGTRSHGPSHVRIERIHVEIRSG